MLGSRFLIYNKKRTLSMILSVTLVTTLLLSVALIFSSFHKYFAIMALKENNYHVSFESEDFKKPNYVKKKIYENGKVYLKYKDISKTYTNTKKICNTIKCKNISYNNKLLSLYGLSSGNTLKSIKKLLISVLVILGVSTLILIKNSFNLSLTQRKKHLGILKSVGATKFQIILSLFEEATIVLFLSLLFGIITSLWFTEVLLFIINYLLKDIFETKIVLSFYISFIIIALSFIILIFYLSIFIPSFKICKVNTMHLLKENDTFKSKKIPKFIYHLNPIKRLAFSNYYRLKKKYRPIKLCVLISSILYISFSLYLNYGLSSIDKYITIPKYDFFLSTKGNLKNYEMLKRLSNKYQKTKIYFMCTIQGSIDKNSYLNKFYNQKEVIVVKSKKEGIVNYIKIDKEKGKVQNINKKYLKDNIVLNINEKVTIKSINSVPFGLEDFITKENIVFLTSDFDKYCRDYTLNMYIKDKGNIVKDLEKLKIKDEVVYTDVKKATRLTKNFTLAIKLSLNSILILVIIISISLITSTFRVTIYNREKEFGMLKSIGMTDLSLKKLLFLESFIILFKTFIFIIPLSYLISYVLYQSINNTVATIMINPKNELIITFVFAFLIIYYSLISSYNIIKRKSIMEMINKENI